MKKFIEFIKQKELQETGAGAGGVYLSKAKIDGSWQGAPRGVPEPLSSVGSVRVKKRKGKK